jgi:hypothetical protein
VQLAHRIVQDFDFTHIETVADNHYDGVPLDEAFAEALE